MNYRFRFRFEVLGAHTHVRLFAGQGSALGKCGDLVFRNEEFVLFRESFESPGPVEFVHEEAGPDDQDDHHRDDYRDEDARSRELIHGNDGGLK